MPNIILKFLVGCGYVHKRLQQHWPHYVSIGTFYVSCSQNYNVGQTAVVLVSCGLQCVKTDMGVYPEESPGSYLSLSTARLLPSIMFIVFSVSVRKCVFTDISHILFLSVGEHRVCVLCLYICVHCTDRKAL